MFFYVIFILSFNLRDAFIDRVHQPPLNSYFISEMGRTCASLIYSKIKPQDCAIWDIRLIYIYFKLISLSLSENYPLFVSGFLKVKACFSLFYFFVKKGLNDEKV